MLRGLPQSSVGRMTTGWALEGFYCWAVARGVAVTIQNFYCVLSSGFGEGTHPHQSQMTATNKKRPSVPSSSGTTTQGSGSTGERAEGAKNLWVGHGYHRTSTRKRNRTSTMECDTTHNILQINISGLQNKKEELEKMMRENNIKIALIQETILPKKPIHITGYTMYPCTCENGCQGIMTLIRNDTEAKVVNKSVGKDLDIQTINMWDRANGTQYNLYNIYCPPNSKPNIHPINPHYTRTIFAGDFNAHSPNWGYSSHNNRGKLVEALCNETNLILMQDKETETTLLHRKTGATSRPDLTMISADIVDTCQIKVMDDIGSDHKPILISIYRPEKLKQKRRTLWNFKRADWSSYRVICLTKLEKIDNTKDISTVYNEISNALLTAAKKTIPRGNRKRYKPFWNTDLERLVSERRQARKKVEKNPTRENKTAYNRLTAQVRYQVRMSKKNHWNDTCNKLNLQKDGHKAWGLLHSLEGKRTRCNPQPLEGGGCPTPNNNKQANILNKHFAKVNHKLKRKQLDTAMTKVLRKQEKKLTANIKLFDTNFTPTEMKSALRKLKNGKTPGPDKITNEMMKNLCDKSLSILLKFINRTWKEGKLPSAWLTAIIRPILKKDKSPTDPKSYRPISLTSCIGKLAERMVNSRLYWWLEQTESLDSHQAGFRKGYRTEDQLFRFVQDTVDGFQQHKNTTAVFIDLQQAYDRVWRQGLFLKMNKLGIHGKLFAWIQAFLRNRTIRTIWNGSLSRKQTIHEGLPQGSSLSCTLFLIFLNDLPPLLEVSKAMYADDLVIWVTEKYPVLARVKLKRALTTIGAYCNLWKLKLNTQKTTYSIFTRSPKVAKREHLLKINGETVKKEENPSYLGVNLDRQLNLSNFITSLKEKATKRLNLVKRLASFSWGANKHTLRQLYLGYVRSIMEYGHSIQTVASGTVTSLLDRVQNQALRMICGGLRTTPTAACEIESNIEPLDLRRQRATLEATERYKRLPTTHPNRKQIENWKKQDRLKQISPIHAAETINEKHHLPEEREPLQKFSVFPPGKNINIGHVRPYLIDPKITKNSDPNLLKITALETIDSYGTAKIQAYTDGSAFKATTNAGAGVLLKFPDGSSLDSSIPCGKYCSNYVAEIKAIDHAITLISDNFTSCKKPPTDIVIFTDSQSALLQLQDITETTDTDVSSLAYNIDKLLAHYNIEIFLQWIPGHSGVHGNEKADVLAKQGSSREQPTKPTNMQTVRQIMRNNIKEEWLNRWTAGSTGRAMYREMTAPKKKDSINCLNRRDQCTIFQWRTTHARVNAHLNRTDPLHPPLCRHCSGPQETTHHLLLECQKLKSLREEFLPPHPSVSNTLYAPVAQLKKTCQFIRLSLSEKE